MTSAMTRGRPARGRTPCRRTARRARRACRSARRRRAVRRFGTAGVPSAAAAPGRATGRRLRRRSLVASRRPARRRRRGGAAASRRRAYGRPNASASTGSGGLVLRRVLALVAVFVGPASRRTSRRPRRDGRTRGAKPDRRAAARQGAARGAVRRGRTVVLIGHSRSSSSELGRGRNGRRSVTGSTPHRHPTGAYAGCAVRRRLTRRLIASLRRRRLRRSLRAESATTSRAGRWE